MPIRISLRHSPSKSNKLWHVSNLYEIPEAERVARRLCEASFADVVFFCNSGAEAVECAIKTARKYHSVSGRPERYRIITFEGAFHGRTLATLAAGGQKKYLDGFGPVVEGFDQMPFGDLAATKRAVGDRNRGDHDRAADGRRRRARGRAVVPARLARALRPAWPAPHLRRGADRHGAHRRIVLPTSAPASPPTSCRSPRRSAAAFRSARASRPARRR